MRLNDKMNRIILGVVACFLLPTLFAVVWWSEGFKSAWKELKLYFASDPMDYKELE